MTKEFAKLALDLSKGQVQNFSAQQSNDVLRKAILDEIGVQEMTWYAYQENKFKIFAIISETISPIINDRLEEVMGRFAEVRNIAFGDTLSFDIENPNLFEVAIIADGTGNLRRQRLDNGKLNMEMSTYAVKIYEEFYRFLSGRINWDGLVNKVVMSYEKKIAQAVHDALYGGYSSIAPEFKYTGTYNEDELLRVLSNIEALYGNALVVGTKPALAKIQPSYAGEADKSAYNALGYLGTFRGYDTVALTQSFKVGTYTPNLSNSDLLILPATTGGFVKIVTEGTAIVLDNQNVNGDLSMEHTFIQKAGVAVSLTDKYGIVRFT